MSAWRPLTSTEVLDLQDIFVRTYREERMPAGGYAELWYRVINEFMGWSGDEVVPVAIRSSEHKVLEYGIAEEYFAALLDVVNIPDGATDAEKAVLLIVATAEERELALKRVLPGGKRRE